MRKLLWALIVVALCAAITSCTNTYLGRMISLRGPDVGDYAKLPSRPVANATTAKPLPQQLRPTWMAEAALAFETRDLSSPESFDAFVADADTTAFIVLHRGYIVDERYFNGFTRDSLYKSFSISKSILSAAFGIAQAEGLIARTDTLGSHIPDLENDALRAVPLSALLDNVSGFEYQRGNLPWKQQPRMYYTTDVRAYLRTTKVLYPPGKKFEAEDLSPLFVAYALESAIQRVQANDTLSDFVSRKLWIPLGAEYPALWNLDHEGNGLEKAESGFTARARDLARFGQLFLDQGVVAGRQVVPSAWVAESITAPLAESPNLFTDGHYHNLWWGARRSGRTRQDFYANGHFGQRIYVVPDKQLVLVRLGRDSGGVDWTAFLGEIADRWPNS